jgi:hypothetical protein
MKIRAARATLSVTWVIGSVPLLIIVALQTFNGVYGKEWDKGWLWIMGLLFPVLGSIIGSWSVGKNEEDNFEVASSSIFWMTMIMSLVYFAILWGGIISAFIIDKNVIDYQNKLAEYQEHIDFVMRATSWPLGAFQALISIALAKFFIENIHPPRPKANYREERT